MGHYSPPAEYGDSVTFTAAIPAYGSITPTGTIDFSDWNGYQGGDLGTSPVEPITVDGLVVDGASVTIDNLAPFGTDISASYNGDTNYAAMPPRSIKRWTWPPPPRWPAAIRTRPFTGKW